MEEVNANKSASTDEADAAMDGAKAVLDLLQGIQRLWGAPPMQQAATPASDPQTVSRASVEAAIRKWQAFTAAMSTPGSLEALTKGAGTMPDILTRLAQSTFNGFLHIQQKWLEQAGRLGETSQAYQFHDLDQSMLRVWAETYEKEFQQFFRIPQLGLTRSYQEKLQLALDKSNVFQSTLAEYIRMLCLPINRSFTVMDEQLAQMAEAGKLPSDPQEYYRMWVRILEGHYMTMYRSPEYLKALSTTLASLAQYSKARDEVCEDLLNTMPIPGRKEIDDLEREVFELKKRITTLERKQNPVPEKKDA